MKRTMVSILLSMALAMGTLAACGGNACEDAADKLEECGFGSSGSGGSINVEGECTSDAECVSNCILDASCDEIEDMFNMTGIPDMSSDFAQCVMGCN